MKDFLVLTSTIGNRDPLKDPDYIFDSCDYIAISDIKYDTKIWNLYNNYDFSSIDEYSDRRNAKIYKVLSSLFFPDYKYIIWHDTNHQLVKDPIEIIEEYGDADLYLRKHPIRNCAYEEMQAVLGNLDTKQNIIQQYQYYQNKLFPTNYGLFAMGTYMKKLSNNIRIMEFKWWEQICKFSSRDQCSFTYCLRDMEINNLKLDIKILKGESENTLINNKYFKDRGTRLK